MDGISDTRGKILNNSSKFYENSSKILKKLNLPEIPVTSIAAKMTKK